MANKKRIDSNLLIALGVLICSFLGLLIYLQQARIMREQTDLLLQQTKASAWPNLQVGLSLFNTSKKSTDSLKIVVANKGIGPAIIERVKVTYDGQIVKNWWDLFDKAKVPDSVSTGISNRNINKSVISANEKFFWLQLNNDQDLTNWIYTRTEKIKIEIYYKSVFGDYWLLTKDGIQNTSETIAIKNIDDHAMPKEKDAFTM